MLTSRRGDALLRHGEAKPKPSIDRESWRVNGVDRVAALAMTPFFVTVLPNPSSPQAMALPMTMLARPTPLPQRAFDVLAIKVAP